MSTKEIRTIVFRINCYVLTMELVLHDGGTTSEWATELFYIDGMPVSRDAFDAFCEAARLEMEAARGG